MKTIKKIATLFVFAIMVFNQNISASAQNYTLYDFYINAKGNIVYTPSEKKDNDNDYATVRIYNQSATRSISLQICDSNHRPVSDSITIDENANGIYNIPYTYPLIPGKTYCLKIVSNYYVYVSGYWIP